MCESTPSLLALLGHAESDAWLALGLAFYLSVVPLTLQLSSLSGFLWGRTLQGNRAQRIEMLLLHEFHRRKFMLPDRPDKRAGAGATKGPGKGGAAHGKKAAAKQGKGGGGGGGGNATQAGGPEEGEDVEDATPAAAAAAGAGKSKGPQYAGARPAPHASLLLARVHPGTRCRYQNCPGNRRRYHCGSPASALSGRACPRILLPRTEHSATQPQRSRGAVPTVRSLAFVHAKRC